MRIAVHRSAVIEAPIDRVWAVLRDFNGHRSWHPAVISSQMEGGLDGDVVGGVRRFTLAASTEIREQLLAHSDTLHSLTYSILDSTLPLFDYVATLRLRPVTDGDTTFLEWRCQFRTSTERAAELEELVGAQICEAGIAGLRRHLSEQKAPSAQPVGKAAEVAVSMVAKGDPLRSKALVRAPAGSSETAALIAVSVPSPKSGQVRIRLTAMGINPPADQSRTGSGKAENGHWSPSIEGVGEVIDVGPQVHGLFPGDRVAYIDDSFGAYAEIRCVDADACINLPDSITDIQASSLYKGISALLLLTRVFNAEHGSTIMVQAVAGGTGHLISQWARSMGLTVLGTVSSDEAARFSRRQGCDYPIFITDPDTLRNDVMRITNGRGVNYWVSLGDSHELETAFACMANLGHIAVLGCKDGESIPIDATTLHQRSLTLSAPSWHHYIRHRPYRQRIANKLFTEIANGNIMPTIETIPMAQSPEVFQQLKTRPTLGALTLVSD